MSTSASAAAAATSAQQPTTTNTDANTSEQQQEIPPELSVIAAQAKAYLEDNVAFVLLQGLKSLARERPENPADYLALYLLQRNPNTRDYTVEVPLRNANASSGPS